MAQFLDDYETADMRIHKFWDKHPNGRINTSAEYYEADKRWVVRTEVYRDIAEFVPASTGYAEEVIGSTMVNKTSALENCETSSIARALSNLGFSKKGSRVSAEEMQKVERLGGTPIPVKTTGEKWGVGVENMGKEATPAQIQTITKRIKEFALDVSVKPVTIKWEMGCMSLYAGREIKNYTELTRAEASQIIEDASNAFEILKPKYLDLLQSKKEGK